MSIEKLLHIFDGKETFFGAGVGLVSGGLKYFYGSVLLHIDFAKDIEAVGTAALSALAGAIVVHIYKKIVERKKRKA